MAIIDTSATVQGASNLQATPVRYLSVTVTASGSSSSGTGKVKKQ